MAEKPTQKLTKKQKKAAAFRANRGNKGKGKANPEDLEDNAIPAAEIQDDLEIEGEGEGPVVEVEKAVEKPKKRKREPNEDSEEPSKKIKKQKKEGDEDSGKQRFILFVGNLRYTTSIDVIKAHFSACDPPPSVRLLTPKSTGSQQSNKSKGCAFLEFSNKAALQQALKLHQSELDGRRINVELTAGGGGKGEGRLDKLKKRNKELNEQRKKRVKKQAESGAKVPLTPTRPQRYSTTSGVEEAPTTAKTWTVGEADDGKTHRGGVKHKKRGSKKPSKSFGTGANAVAVG